MNNEIIKLIADLLYQREADSPIDWNDLENDYSELEEILENALKNPKLFDDLGDEFSNKCNKMLNCISELDDDLTAYPGENGDETDDEKTDRRSDRLETLRTTLEDTIENLKSVLPKSKTIENYDVQIEQRNKSTAQARKKVREFEDNAEFYIKLHGKDKYESELKRLKKIRRDTFDRNAPK